MNFILIGDWGGADKPPYSTPQQLLVRDIMDGVSSKHNVTAIISCGDNYYKKGVKNEYDVRFKQTFENVYNTTNLLNIPWFAINGDHDWKGNVSAQIEYSSKHSLKWNMYNYYYTKIWKISSKTSLQIIFIDTIILCENNKNIGSKSDIQYKWIENTLKQSNSTYILIVGHYPIYSYSWHGPTKCLNKLKYKILNKYKHKKPIIGYVCGHDHILQFIEIKNEFLHFIVSGAGHNGIKITNHLNDKYNPNWQQSFKFKGGRNGGFVRLYIDDNYAKMYFYESDNESVIYSTGNWYPNGTYINIDDDESNMYDKSKNNESVSGSAHKLDILMHNNFNGTVLSEMDIIMKDEQDLLKSFSATNIDLESFIIIGCIVIFCGMIQILRYLCCNNRMISNNLRTINLIEQDVT